MLVGVLLARAAVPSLDTDKVKSLASKAPLPPSVLNTATLNVTAMVLLSAAKDMVVITGAVWSLSLIVLLLCEVAAALPLASKIALEAGLTVRVSSPVGVPDRSMPNVYTLPLTEILVGVAADKVAAPPEMEKTKSLASKAPLPLLVLNTASDMVTAKVVLSAAKATPVMVGGPLSLSLTVLLL